MRRATILGALLLIALSACDTGPGSRVAPFFADRPGSVLVGEVLDTKGQGIVSATVSIAGFGSSVTDAFGRFEFANPPRGNQVVTVDGRAASATGSDRFGKVSRTLVLPTGSFAEIERPFVLPDLSSTANKSIALGAQASASTIDGRVSGAGPVVTVDAASVVARTEQGSGSFLLEVATVPAADLAVALPTSSVGAWLPTRAAWIEPADVTFSSGTANVAFSNELAVGTGAKARVFYFDRSLNEWTSLGDATESAGLLVPDAKVLTKGGLYVAAVEVAATTVEAVVQDLSQRPLPTVFASAFGRTATTDAAGRVSVGPVPAVDAAGAPLTFPLRLRTSVSWTPWTSTHSLTASTGTSNAGTIRIPAGPGGTIRYFLAFRGEPLPTQVVRAGGSVSGGTLQNAEADGFGIVPGLAAGWCGASASWVEGPRFFRGEAIGEILPRTFGVDVQVLAREEELRQGELKSSFFGRFVDDVTGAPIADAIVQGSADPNTGNKSSSTIFGEVQLNGDRFGIITAGKETFRRDGRAMRSLVSVTKIDNIRIEFPITRYTRATEVRVAPHALLVGSLVGASTGSVRRSLVHGLLRENDWFSRALGVDVANESKLPRAVDPAVTGGDAYRLGVPPAFASVAMLEGSLVSSRFVPQRIAILPDLRSGVGAENRIDLAFGAAFDRNVVLSGLEASRDPGILASSYEYKLGAVLTSGRVIDVSPWSAGAVVQGSDLRVLAPSDSGELLGARLMFAVRATQTGGGVTRRQELFGSDALANEAREFLGVPAIQSPTPGATVARSDEIEVTWSSRTDVDFYELSLEAIGARTEDRRWRVVLPGDATTFKFGVLVPEMTKVVGPGLAWRLSIAAHRLARGPAFDRRDGYQRIAGNLFSFRDGHRGVGARSTVQIEFSTP